MTLHTLEFIALANNSKGDAMSEEIEWITAKTAMAILGVTTRQGVHYILNNLPDDAPEIRKIENRISEGYVVFRYAKSDIEALRDYRFDNP